MENIKAIVVNGPNGQQEYGIEDAEARENVQEIVEGAPEELDSFKEAFEKFKEGGDALTVIAEDVERNAEAIAAEATRATEVEQALGKAITDEATRAEQAEAALGKAVADNKELATNAPNLALRALFVAAGAEYNDSGIDKTKTAPWGETVTHKAGHYYLNGIGDITEKQMAVIYSKGNTLNLEYNLCDYIGRTNLPLLSIGTSTYLNGYYYANNCYAEVINLSKGDNSIVVFESTYKSERAFSYCHKLKAICGRLMFANLPHVNIFYNSKLLQFVNIYKLKYNLSLATNSIISKESILYMIQNANPSSAITITLHADAYARLANDADIVAALEAQPLVTLVSA